MHLNTKICIQMQQKYPLNIRNHIQLEMKRFKLETCHLLRIFSFLWNLLIIFER